MVGVEGPFAAEEHGGEEAIVGEVEEGEDGLGEVGDEDVAERGADGPVYCGARVGRGEA